MCLSISVSAQAIFETQFMKKLSNAEAELTKTLLIKKACNIKILQTMKKLSGSFPENAIVLSY